MINVSKRVIIPSLLLAAGIASIILIPTFLFNKIKENIGQKLEDLEQKGFHIRYDSIRVDWKENQAEICNVIITKDPYDTRCLRPEFISAQKITIKNFGWLQLLLNKKIKLGTLEIHHPHIALKKHSQLLPDSIARRQQHSMPTGLEIGMVIFDSAQVEMFDSTGCQLKANLRSTIRLISLEIDFKQKRTFMLTLDSATLDAIRIHFENSLYLHTIRSARADFVRQRLLIDSLKIIPLLSKVDFGRKKGHDVDRVEATFPEVAVAGFSVRHPDTLIIAARHVTTRMFLKIFHDKRLPHLQEVKPFPLELLRKLPFGIHLDTLSVVKSYVRYEEVSAASGEAGFIFFDDIHATIFPVRNDRAWRLPVTMQAQALFMGQGKLRIEAVFPNEPNQKNTLHGSLVNFSMPQVNSILEPASNLQAERGVVDNFRFTFKYDKRKSTGEVELNYHDLKLVTFKNVGKNKNKRREVKQDNLKTFILNAFVIRKNAGEDMRGEKQAGTISCDRDPTRSIFHYWWKSLLSGIKSASNLQGLEKISERKNIRSKKRELRKQKREDRKNEP